MNDFKLRPYRIAAEIDSMFDGKHLTGIGELEFVGCKQTILTDEYAGICLQYAAIHGDDDKKEVPKPQDNPAHVQDFKNIIEGYE